MKDKGIRLHPEHGLNPSLLQCFACGGDAGVAILGYNGGKEAPRKMATVDTFCQKCEEHMKLGVILIEARNGESGQNPYRTGRQWVVTEEAVRKAFDPKIAEAAAKYRVSFIEENAAKQLGLYDIEPTMGHVDMGEKS
jgi:hypothetical protein